MSSSLITIFGMSFNLYGAILLVVALVFFCALWRAQRKKQFDWTDLITRDGHTVSATKLLQLVGGVVGTWIIIKVTMNDRLTWDLFAIYLAYVASIDGFSKLMMAKYGSQSSDDTRQSYRRYSYGRSYEPEDEVLEAPRPGGAKTPDPQDL